MSRICFILCCGLLALFGSSAASANSIVKIRVDDTVQPITAEYIDRAIEHARQTNADAVLIELSTPGGLLDSTRSIIQTILASPVPVIIYVAPSGARAASAGFFILEAADVAAMAPGTNTGAAHPVTLGGEKMDDIMKAKVENDSAAFMRSYVGPRGRNVQLAETAVRESKSWTDQEALQQHLIEIVAHDQSDLLRQIDGRTIKRFDGKTVKLHLTGDSVDELPMTLKQRILDFLLDPNIAFLVLAVGALALYAEFNHPGAIVPGVVGVVFILLALFALNLLPTRYASFTLIIARLCAVRPGSKICNSRSARPRRDSSAHDRWAAAGGWAYPANAGATMDGARGQRTSRNHYSFPDDHRPAGATKQGRDRRARHDWRGG